MTKVALLIGVGNYKNLHSLPSAVRDVSEFSRVLRHPEMGNFDEVQTLTDVSSPKMREEIEKLFSQCQKDDLVLLFFSGHGIKDERNKLYLAVPDTYKDNDGKLVRSSAVEAQFIEESMSRSRSKRQVLLLDCCFSGAFGEGYTAKDDGMVNIEEELGGEGRAILTSSTSSQYAYEQQGTDLSIYTRYLIEGIETGAADRDSDGVISTDELHEYVKQKVKASAPAMQPKIFTREEGFRISLAHAPTPDPEKQYRREIEYWAKYGAGNISDVGRQALALKRAELGITESHAAAIETEVLAPHRRRRKNLATYEQALRSALARENPLSARMKAELSRFQEILGLEDDDVKVLMAKIASEQEASDFTKPQGALQTKSSAAPPKYSAPGTPTTPTPSFTNVPDQSLPAQTQGFMTPTAGVSSHGGIPQPAAVSPSSEPSSNRNSGKPWMMVGLVGALGAALAVAVFTFMPVEEPKTLYTIPFPPISPSPTLWPPIEEEVIPPAELARINQEAEEWLASANDLYRRAPDDGASLINQAVALLQGINPDSDYYREAQARIQSIDLDKAGRDAIVESYGLYINGDFDAAKDELESIDPNSFYYEDSDGFEGAQTRIAAWTDAWEANHYWQNLANDAIDATPPDKAGAEQATFNIDPNTPYWTGVRQSLFAEVDKLPSAPVVTDDDPETKISGMTAEECEALKEQYLNWDDSAVEQLNSEGSTVRADCEAVGVSIGL